MVETLVRNWWALLVRGIAAVLFGLLALFFPGAAGLALVVLFGAYAFVDGVFAIVAAFAAAEVHQRWWAFAVEGAIGIIIAAITFTEPHVTALALYWTIAAWAILTGIVEFVAAAHVRRHVPNEIALIVGGVLSILFGILLFVFPAAGIPTVIWLIGVYAIVFGVVMIVLAVRLRRFGGAGKTAQTTG